MDKLRTVICGCGGISGAWMGTPAMRELVDIVGVVDLRPEAAAAFVAKHGLGTIPSGGDLNAMLALVKPEAVFDLTIPAAHHRVTLAALAAGCHVLGEKPMADTVAQGLEMVAAAERAGRVYAVTQTRRYDQRLRRVRAVIDRGDLGRVHTVWADFAIAAHFGGFRETMEHVLILDMAIHSFDQARVLLPSDPVAVRAEEWNPPGSWYGHGANANALFRCADGARFAYRGTWTATGHQTSWQCQWRIFGDRGTAWWDGDDEVRIEQVTDPAQPSAEHGGGLIRRLSQLEPPPIVACRGGHDGAIHDFVTSIRAGRLPETHAAANLPSLAMVHAAIAAAASGREESVLP